MPREDEPQLTRRQLFVDTGYRIAGITASGLFLAACKAASSPSDISLHISHPIEGGQVRTSDYVAGTISGQLQPQERIIVFLEGLPGNQPYHPQWPPGPPDNPIFFQFENEDKTNWKAEATFGYPGNGNQDVNFRVLATRATKSGLLAVRKYAVQCNQTKKYPGLNEIPAGIDIMATINQVTRKAGT